MANIIDSYSEANQDAGGFIDDISFDGIGQAFTGNGAAVGSSVLLLKKLFTPSGNIFSKIYAGTGTFGTDFVPSGAALATSDAVDSSTTTVAYGLITFTFSGANQITLTNGTHYVVTIESTAFTGSNGVGVGENASPGGHSGNLAILPHGSGWTNNANRDAIFYVYDNAAGATTSTSSTSSSTSTSISTSSTSSSTSRSTSTSSTSTSASTSLSTSSTSTSLSTSSTSSSTSSTTTLPSAVQWWAKTTIKYRTR